ncbi:MAG: TolC family protein [Desulfopila sp.]
MLTKRPLSLALLLLTVAATGQAATNEPPQDLSLKSAVETALANNLNLTLKKEDTAIAAGSTEIARSRFDRYLSAETGLIDSNSTSTYVRGVGDENSQYADVSLNKRLTTGTEVAVGWANSRYDGDDPQLRINPAYKSMLELTIRQPLLRGLGNEVQTGQLRAAEIEYTASTYQVNSTAADLAAQVKNSYWDLVFAWQDIEVKRFSASLARTLLEETKTKIEAGALAEIEVYQPESELARREEDLIAAEQAIGLAEDELKLLLNSKDWQSVYSPTDSPGTEPIEVEQEQVLENALHNRPDLKAAKMYVDASRIRQRVAEDDLRPQLNLNGRVGYGGLDDGYGQALDAAKDDPDTIWEVGLELSVPLDNSAARGSLQQARAQHAKARTSMQLLRLDITKNVRTTVRNIELAIKAMEATRKTSLATKKSMEAEQAKFNAGRSTTIDVLIAQETYARALSQENKTNIYYAKTLAELDRIQGYVTLTSARQIDSNSH